MSPAAQDMSCVFVCFLDSDCCPCSTMDKLRHDLFLAAIGIESYNKATRWHTYWCSTPPRSVISCLLTQKVCFPLWRGFPCDQYMYIYICEECICGSMRYITSSYMATAFGSRPPWSSLHGPSEDSTASLNTRVLRPKTE